MNIKLAITLLLAVGLSSCTSFKYGVEDGAAAAAGAAIGHAIDDDNEAYPITGALIGALTSNTIRHKSRYADAKNEGVKDGYVLGKSDAIKSHYWMLQEQQKGDLGGETVVYDLDIPQTLTQDGKQLVPRRLRVPFIE